MRNWRKVCGVLFVMTLAAGMMISSYGATRKKISSVNISVESKIELDTQYGEETINVTVKGSNYSFDYYEINNVGFSWLEEDVPDITLYFRADEGYYFSLSKASQVKLTGATYVKASRQDSSETLALQVKLPPMSESLGEGDGVSLTEGGYAVWNAIRGAGSYESRLYRNGEGVGSNWQTTDQLYYDYTKEMRRPGVYMVKVRPVNKVNNKNKGEWMMSETIQINESMAEAIRNGTAPGLPIRGEWMRDDVGKYYMHEDGTYTQNDWERIEREWYFFDEKGYMKTGWIEWNGKKYYCDDKTGRMLTSTMTPDGIILDANGNPKND